MIRATNDHDPNHSRFWGSSDPKLPAPREDDLSAGILETIDMESYRVEKREAMKIALADEDHS